MDLQRDSSDGNCVLALVYFLSPRLKFSIALVVYTGRRNDSGSIYIVVNSSQFFLHALIAPGCFCPIWYPAPPVSSLRLPVLVPGKSLSCPLLSLFIWNKLHTVPDLMDYTSLYHRLGKHCLNGLYHAIKTNQLQREGLSLPHGF